MRRPRRGGIVRTDVSRAREGGVGSLSWRPAGLLRAPPRLECRRGAVSPQARRTSTAARPPGGRANAKIGGYTMSTRPLVAGILAGHRQLAPVSPRTKGAKNSQRGDRGQSGGSSDGPTGRQERKERRRSPFTGLQKDHSEANLRRPRPRPIKWACRHRPELNSKQEGNVREMSKLSGDSLTARSR